MQKIWKDIHQNMNCAYPWLGEKYLFFFLVLIVLSDFSEINSFFFLNVTCFFKSWGKAKPKWTPAKWCPHKSLMKDITHWLQEWLLVNNSWLLVTFVIVTNDRGLKGTFSYYVLPLYLDRISQNGPSTTCHPQPSPLQHNITATPIKKKVYFPTLWLAVPHLIYQLTSTQISWTRANLCSQPADW